MRVPDVVPSHEWKTLNIFVFLLVSFVTVKANAGGNVLGCGGFIKSHSPIDFTKIEVKLYTKTGTLKDNTFCAPNNGYYFLPLYEKGEYLLQINPPTGWSFTPKQVRLHIDGSTDPCSKGKDINFVFAGFGITGQVDNVDGGRGPIGVKIELSGNQEVRETVTDENGKFFFTPVFPGTYTVIATHSKWKLKKDKYTVQVATENTELPKSTFLISGYDVRGTVTFERRPISNILFLLYNDSNQPVFAENCNTEKHPDVQTTEDYICYVKSKENGLFEFPTLSPGAYKLRPVFKGKHINYHIHPEEMKFRVVRDSLTLPHAFEVRSFTISGRVLMNTDGNNVQGATIFVNDKPVTTTRSDGSFVLKKVNAGSTSIFIESPGLKFSKKTIKISPYIEVDSDFLPLAFQVCGNVVSENVHTIVFRTLDTNTEMHVHETETSKETGDFCTFLPAGKYTASVISDVADVQFFPVSQLVQVNSAPVNDVNFSQLKASVTGNVRCIQPDDCAGLTVTITQITHDGKVLDKTNIASVNDGLFMFSDVIPGTYEVTLSVNKFCWKAAKHVILVNSETINVPDFLQTGYKIVFLSSHNAQIQYQTIGAEFEQQKPPLKTLQLNAGQNIHCLPHPGTYDFKVTSCHIHDASTFKFNTNTDTAEIILTASKHKVSAEIMSFERSDSLNVSVTIGTTTTRLGPITPKNRDNAFYYEVSIHLSENEEALLVPHSDILWFKPTSLTLIGESDCANHGPRIMGLKGRLIKGTVLPTLEGVRITVIGPGQEEYVRETDASGRFQFPTLDDSHSYKVSATKLSYVFTGPDAHGNFHAHKLAEITVMSVDGTDQSPLQGTLISLSGGESYRSNLQTDANGTINFMSLQPNEYFLRPMMKEYNFEPSSKIVQLAEGAKVVVQLSGKRVAYSVYGSVNSLSGEPENRMIVIAAGTDSCSQYNEEAMSEEKGQFRVRGLHPQCVYEIRVKQADSAQQIERVIPDSISLQTNHKDINDVKLITLRHAQHTDLIVQILSSKPEYFRTLRLKVCKDAFPNLPVYNLKLDSYVPKTLSNSQSGILIHLPPVAMDGKQYFLQLESTLSQAVYSYKTETEYFIANTSFKSFTLKFDSKSQENDQDMVQTSVFALPVFLLCLVGMYHAQYIIQFLSELVQKHNVFASIMRPKSPVATRAMENSDIDQIVQNINTVKRKVRPRKV